MSSARKASDAWRAGDPLVNGYCCFGAYHWQVTHSSLSPLMLRPWSTRQPLFHSENDLIDRWFWTPRQVRHEYALRWRAEDGKRLLGQIWHVERFLVQSFLALARLLWCVRPAGGFLAMLQREEPALCQQRESEVLYLIEDCALPGYRLARGVQAAAIRQPAIPVLNNA